MTQDIDEISHFVQDCIGTVRQILIENYWSATDYQNWGTLGYKELLKYCLEDDGHDSKYRQDAIKHMIKTMEGHLVCREKYLKTNEEHWEVCLGFVNIPKFISSCRKREAEVQQMNQEVLEFIAQKSNKLRIK